LKRTETGDGVSSAAKRERASLPPSNSSVLRQNPTGNGGISVVSISPGNAAARLDEKEDGRRGNDRFAISGLVF